MLFLNTAKSNSYYLCKYTNEILKRKENKLEDLKKHLRLTLKYINQFQFI